MRDSLVALIAGLVFGIGLIISQMVDPEKVLGFLDFGGDWDPSLAFVMGGAIALSALGALWMRRLDRPLIASRFDAPQRTDPDPRLIAGAAVFGVGGGLVGLCPGPAIAALPFGPWQAFVFLAAMIVGMVLFHHMPSPGSKTEQARRTGRTPDA